MWCKTHFLYIENNSPCQSSATGDVLCRAAGNRTRSLPPAEPQMRPAHLVVNFVGLPGIEPGLHAPEACVLPAYSSPTKCTTPIRMYYCQASRAVSES